jgi:hypothetical protein
MVQPVGPVQKTAELDLDMGKRNSQEQSQPRNPGKAAIIDVSPEAIEKSKAEISRIGKEVRSSEPYKGKAYSDTAIKSSGGGGGIPKLNRDISKNMRSGGAVSSASKRADGCAIRGKTRA